MWENGRRIKIVRLKHRKQIQIILIHQLQTELWLWKKILKRKNFWCSKLGTTNWFLPNLLCLPSTQNKLIIEDLIFEYVEASAQRNLIKFHALVNQGKTQWRMEEKIVTKIMVADDKKCNKVYHLLITFNRTKD